ncbi:hypothetical protein, partial [Brachyspira hampsonii]|uniref:hypothetical protein n=1 Tax=Brachyspira hampsonii TaxID=1287055 RepID=UPI0002AE1E23
MLLEMRDVVRREIKKETEIKFENYLNDLNNKIDAMNDDISIWKENNINDLLSQLETAKQDISAYLDTTEDKKNKLISEVLSKIEERENNI